MCGAVNGAGYLAARIDRPILTKKRLLQNPPYREDVPFPRCVAVAALLAVDLQAALSRPPAAELLYRFTLFPEPEYPSSMP